MSQHLETTTDAAFEAMPLDSALARLGSSREGLSEAEAAKRLAEHGANVLPPAVSRSSFARFIDQFRSVLIYVLIGAAIMTAIIGHWIDTAVIMAVVIANAIIGWFQEGRAEQALAAVSKLLAAGAVVLRDGTRRQVDASELVPGDVVFIQSGDRVPADLRLIEATSLSVDESLLTGESLPVAKKPEPVEAGQAIGDRTSMAFSGTTVAAGQATGLVTTTGRGSELGKIGHMVESVEAIDTPLLDRLSYTARLLTFVILGLSVVTFAAGYFIGVLPLEELFLAAVGLAVSAIPEGLPAIMTIILAFGVRRMAAKGALIRRLPAVETLGSVTVICTDKTGTLTRNELVAREIVTGDVRYGVTGEGYGPEGEITGEDGAPIDATSSPHLSVILRNGALCNDARLAERDGVWSVAGDPVEGALLALAEKAGVARDDTERDEPRVAVLPFESDYRYMATLHDRGGRRELFVKGAPEKVLELCESAWTPEGPAALDADGWRARVEAMAAEGLRVLAFAFAVRDSTATLDRDSIGSGLGFLGLIGFLDPPRTEVIEAVADCFTAGISVKMITGDHASTAVAIGREVGLDVSAGAVTGTELAALDETEFAETADRVNVFARVDPEQKLRLVTALQAAGHSVAMTGDGVNDAPALRRADIGVAMGRKGSDAARQASGMVLVDDNFATIAETVREGRSVYENLRKTLAYILPTNAGESLLLITAILLGATLPISALQIIWINFVTTTTLSLALAFEPQSEGVMQRKPRPSDASLIDRNGFFQIAYIGVVMAAVAAAIFAFTLNDGRPLEVARALAVNAIVAGEVAFLLVIGTVGLPFGRREAVNRVIPFMIAGVIVIEVTATQWAPVADALGMAPLNLGEWGLVIAAGVVVWVAAVAERAISRRWRSTV